MKKLSCFLVAMLFLLMPALQSCDDNDGYSIGQFGGSWATVRVLSGNTYYLFKFRKLIENLLLGI